MVKKKEEKRLGWKQLSEFLRATGVFEWISNYGALVWAVPKLFKIFVEYEDEGNGKNKKIHVWAAHGYTGRELYVKTFARRYSLSTTLPDVLKAIREVFDEAVCRLEKDAWTLFNMGWDDALIFESDYKDESDGTMPGSNTQQGNDTDDDLPERDQH